MQLTPPGAWASSPVRKRREPSVISSSPAAAATGEHGDGGTQPRAPMARVALDPNFPPRLLAALLCGGASLSLFGDEVLAHLRRRSVHMRACDTAFHIASGIDTSCGAARLILRGEKSVHH
ncbi:hypothetical protein HPB50_011291 [Hyalomma asiaticum]|uniref:Uncharacterized protein n=1 Tax=Hyalomma asiaticum TaxID=266040 RepID=A0ACB7TG44_HYAAI|nr:hypothetical protein HPB50_011291 [Hyalomma asiaticum]